MEVTILGDNKTGGNQPFLPTPKALERVISITCDNDRFSLSAHFCSFSRSAGVIRTPTIADFLSLLAMWIFYLFELALQD